MGFCSFSQFLLVFTDVGRMRSPPTKRQQSTSKSWSFKWSSHSVLKCCRTDHTAIWCHRLLDLPQLSRGAENMREIQRGRPHGASLSVHGKPARVCQKEGRQFSGNSYMYPGRFLKRLTVKCVFKQEMSGIVCNIPVNFDYVNLDHLRFFSKLESLFTAVKLFTQHKISYMTLYDERYFQTLFNTCCIVYMLPECLKSIWFRWLRWFNTFKLSINNSCTI